MADFRLWVKSNGASNFAAYPLHNVSLPLLWLFLELLNAMLKAALRATFRANDVGDAASSIMAGPEGILCAAAASRGG